MTNRDDEPTTPPGGRRPDEDDLPTIVPGRSKPPAEAPERALTRPAAPSKPVPVTPSPDESQVVAVGQVFGGRFEVVGLLGEGGMGTVFRVRDRQIEKREVALKVLRLRYSNNKAFRELFFREIRTAQNFVSENVVQIRDVGQLDDGQLFLTMDHIEGESLAQLLRREKTLVPRQALEIARQMLLGLSSGHEQGFIHRDVKPQNVMLASRVPKTESNPFGVHAQLLDFGIAGLMEEIDGERAAGTPAYMSPEQVNGQRLDPRSDLFAVGVCLYEMISGQRPFQGKTVAEITSAVLDTDLVPMIERLDGLSKPMRRILRKALQKEREKRFPSAAVFIEAIESSSAFKAEEGVPRWVMLLTALFGIGAAATTYGMVEARTRISTMEDSRKGEIEAAEKRGADRIQSGSGDEMTKLLGQLDTLRSEKSAAELARDTNLAEVGTLRGRISQLEDQARIKETEVGRATDDKQDAVTRAEALITAYKFDQEALVKERFAYQLMSMRPLQTAELYDRTISLIERDLVAPGYDAVDAAIAQGQVVDSRTGIELLQRLERAAVMIAGITSATNETDRIGKLWEARAALDWLGDTRRLEQFRFTASTDPEERWLGTIRRSEQEIYAQLRERVAAQARAIVETDAQEAAAAEGAPASTRAQQLDPDKLEQQMLAEITKEIGLPTWRRSLYQSSWSDDAANQRYAKLGTTIAHLEAALAVHEQGIAESAKSEAEAIAVRAGDIAAEVDQYLGRYGSYARPWLGDLIEHVASRYEHLAIDDGGKIDQAAIRTVPASIERLVDSLDALAIQSGATWPALERLMWIAAARSWYATSTDLAREWQSRILSAPVLLANKDRTQDWRAVLALQFQLTRTDARLPLLPRNQAVYEVRARSGETNGDVKGWDLATCEQDGPAKRTILRSRLDERGERPSGSTTAPAIPFFYPTPTSFQQLSDPLVDLRRTADNILGVEVWVPDTAAVERFTAIRGTSTRLKSLVGRSLDSVAAMPGIGYACLVVRTSAVSTAWIHPLLGIVREDESLVSRSLVHLDI